MLLVALESLFNSNGERDVRAAVLHVLLTVLQASAVAGVATCVAAARRPRRGRSTRAAPPQCGWGLLACPPTAGAGPGTAGLLSAECALPQRHGERLSEGWTPVFRLLGAVPAVDAPGEEIALAFQSVALSCADYAPAMPLPRLRRCLEVAALYGQQQVRRAPATPGLRPLPACLCLAVSGCGCCAR